MSCDPKKYRNTDPLLGPLVSLDPAMACEKGWFRSGCGGTERGSCLPGREVSPFFGGYIYI